MSGEEEPALIEPPEIERVPEVSEDKERSMYGDAQPKKPNSLFIRLGSLGHLSWQSEGGIPVLGLLILLLLAITAIVTLIFALLSATNEAAKVFIGAIGQAMLTVIGAVLGASAKRD